jgi:hypothetical protein
MKQNMVIKIEKYTNFYFIAQIQSAKSKDPSGSIEWICKDIKTLGKIGEFGILFTE